MEVQDDSDEVTFDWSLTGPPRFCAPSGTPTGGCDLGHDDCEKLFEPIADDDDRSRKRSRPVRTVIAQSSVASSAAIASIIGRPATGDAPGPPAARSQRAHVYAVPSSTARPPEKMSFSIPAPPLTSWNTAGLRTSPVINGLARGSPVCRDVDILAAIQATDNPLVTASALAEPVALLSTAPPTSLLATMQAMSIRAFSKDVDCNEPADTFDDEMGLLPGQTLLSTDFGFRKSSKLAPPPDTSASAAVPLEKTQVSTTAATIESASCAAPYLASNAETFVALPSECTPSQLNAKAQNKRRKKEAKHAAEVSCTSGTEHAQSSSSARGPAQRDPAKVAANNAKQNARRARIRTGEEHVALPAASANVETTPSSSRVATGAKPKRLLGAVADFWEAKQARLGERALHSLGEGVEERGLGDTEATPG